MAFFLQQVFALLTTDTGSLTYHLVLAFSIAGAMPAAFSLRRGAAATPGRRMVTGLGLLLLFQLVLFALSGLAWQGLINTGLLLPPLDRAVALLSLTLVIWLWAFPEPLRMADAAGLLMGMLILAMLALGTIWRSGQAAGAFNGSWPDTIAALFALVLAGTGAILLLARRPASWGTGFAMLILFALGFLASLILPVPDGDYHGALRLAQMAAYPLLLILPQRFPLAEPARQPEPEATSQVQTHGQRRFGVDPQILPAYLGLAAEENPESMCLAVATAISRTMLADICLIIAPPDPQGNLAIQCGYDLIRETTIQGLALERNLVPTLTTAMRRVVPLRLSTSSAAKDLETLTRVFNTERTGELLAVPVPMPDAPPGSPPAFGILLLSPHSGHSWTMEDQDYLVEISAPLVHLLQRNYKLDQLQNDLSQALQDLESAQHQSDELYREKEELLDQLTLLQQSAEQDRSQLESLAAVVASQQDVRETILRLQEENQNLKEAAGQAFSAPTADVEHVEGELRLSLEEIALLRAALAEAEEKIQALKSGIGDTSAPGEQFEMVASIAQELRQPMSSIVGYTDFLLSESVGILGALQRKFLERVRVATDRMNRLVDDLIQITSMESSQMQLESEAVDLGAIIDEAIASTGNQLREKNIALRVDLPEHLPRLNADGDALQQVVMHLLQNAGTVTPSEGDIFLRACIERSEGDQDYVLLQIADQGGGIAPDDLPRVFSLIYRTEHAHLSGIGDSGVGLSIVKTLVEALGGRIWVDSEQGIGATFSVLLPVQPDEQARPA